MVNDERRCLVEVIAKAEQETATWEQAAGLLATQSETHAREKASGRDELVMAEGRSRAVFDQAVRPLLAQSTVDGQTYLDAWDQQHDAWDATPSAGRLGRRAAQQRLDVARAGTHEAEATTLNRWGSVPATGRWTATTRDGLEAWAARVAHQRAEAQPVVSSAREDVARADEALKQIRWRRRAESEEFAIGVYGRRDAASFRRVSGANSAKARAQRWEQYADAERADLERIESLPIGRAVQFIESRRAQASGVEVEQTVATHRVKLGVPTERRIEQTDPGLGRTL